MSTTVLPALMPSATPSLPKSTFSTSGVSGTIVMMMSARLATAAGLVAALPPTAISASGTPERLKR